MLSNKVYNFVSDQRAQKLLAIKFQMKIVKQSLHFALADNFSAPQAKEKLHASSKSADMWY